MVNDLKINDANAILIRDIDLSSVCGAEIDNWTPIGTSDTRYIGTFDGGNNTNASMGGIAGLIKRWTSRRSICYSKFK